MFKWLIILIFSFNAWGQKIERKVLVLWDSSEVGVEQFEFSLVHSKLEVILNHYGLVAEYLNINNPLPNEYFTAQKIKQYSGLISWFSDPSSKDPLSLLRLYQSWQKHKKKVIILGYFGILSDHRSHNTSLKRVNKLLQGWGIKMTGEEFKNPLVLQVVQKTPQVEFERKLNNELSGAFVVQSLNKKNIPHLLVKDKVNHTQSYFVIETPNLFYASFGHELYQSSYNDVTQWRVNPHYMIKWLAPVFPIPDTTTLYGKRILYSHIDGDAFISISEIDRKSLCGEIIRKEIIDRYQIPISASLVMAEVDEKYRGNKRILHIAKEFFKSPYIEPASHTYFHPLSWEVKPSEYDIELYFPKGKRQYVGGPIVAYQYPDYEQLNYHKEIVDSLNFLNQNILVNEKSDLLFWSGSCRPPLSAMKMIYANSLLDINGGDSRFDKKYNSISHLYPLGKQIDSYVQIYSSNSNENTYTNLWEGPFMGYRDVIETFKNTEFPIRFKPINIYYHFYSGEKISSLKALKDVYQWALKQNIFPLYTSEFIRLARSFYEFNITKLNEKTYQLTNIKNLRTLRIDKEIIPNYKLSENIIGHRQLNQSTYIFLNNHPEAKLVYDTKQSKNKLPYFIESDGFLNNVKIRKNYLSFHFKSHYGKSFTLYTDGHKLKDNPLIEKIKYKNNMAIITLKQKEAHLSLEVLL